MENIKLNENHSNMKKVIEYIKEIRAVGLYLRISKKTGRQVRIL